MLHLGVIQHSGLCKGHRVGLLGGDVFQFDSIFLNGVKPPTSVDMEDVVFFFLAWFKFHISKSM